MRIAVCDDEPEQLELLLNYCRRFDSALPVTPYETAQALLAEASGLDIVFLDIEMPAPNGFEVAQELRKKANPPLVIFVTHSSRYTILGYGIAFRYLQKPVSYEDFAATLSLAIKELQPAKIPFVSDGVCYLLPVNEILYCEVLDHELTVYSIQERYTARSFMAELLRQLPSDEFAQPHKSYLVNLNYVYSVGANTVTLASGGNPIQVPLSKGKRKEFIQRLGEHIGR